MRSRNSKPFRVTLQQLTFSMRNSLILSYAGIVFGVCADWEHSLFHLDFETMSDLSLTFTTVALLNCVTHIYLFFTRSKS